MSELVFENISPFDLAQTLDCGQSFRWKERKVRDKAKQYEREYLNIQFRLCQALGIRAKKIQKTYRKRY